TFSGTINGSGAGLVQFDSGTITIGAAGLNLNFSSGLFNFGGGNTFFSGGTLTNKGYFQITDGIPNIYNATFTNQGTVVQTGGTLRLDQATTSVINDVDGLWQVDFSTGADWLDWF